MDAIIYKCLSNEPMERFQSIEEIENEYNQVKKRKIDVYDDMYTFNDVVRSVLPEAYRLPYETENSKIIEEKNKLSSYLEQLKEVNELLLELDK